MSKSIVREAFGDVDDVEPPARKPPCEPRIDRAETEFAPLGARACAGYVVENPADFGRREVGVENQSRLFADTLRQTASAQHVAVVGRAAILPHDRVVDGFRRLAVPYDGRLALVGNAQRFDIAPFDIGLVDDVLHDEGLRRPDFERVVFDPSRLRELLVEGALRHRDDLAAGVEQDGARGGRPLVERQNVLGFHRTFIVFSVRKIPVRRTRGGGNRAQAFRPAAMRGNAGTRGRRRICRGSSHPARRPTPAIRSRNSAAAGIASVSVQRLSPSVSGSGACG